MKLNFDNNVNWEGEHTAEEYFNQPLEKRTRKVWWWPTLWYKTPLALQWDPFNADEFDEWDKYHKQIKIDFPIQARIREYEQYKIWLKWAVFEHKFKDNVYYPIRSIFKPQNRHLIKHIPRQYKPFGEIIENILIEEFVKYCEGDIYSPLSYQEEPLAGEEFNTFMKKEVEENKKHYTYLKFGRKELSNRIENIWNSFPKSYKKDNEELRNKISDEIRKLEEEQAEKDNEALAYVVKKRWTMD